MNTLVKRLQVAPPLSPPTTNCRLPTAMHASIIIPTRNRSDLLLALLRSIEQTNGGNEEVIVVDDGSTDGTVDEIQKHFPAVRVLQTATPSGPSVARNLGARHARGTLLLFLDVDGEVDTNWRAAMTDADDGQTVLLGNVVDFTSGRVQSVPRRATFLGKSLGCRPEGANTGPSCNLGIPRALFETLGGFDEELPYYFEDSDLCIRARRTGARFRFVPGAIFRHHGTERKTGEAIRLQEQHSTYAMLKYYEGQWIQGMAFSVVNGSWMMARCAVWCLQGRCDDASRLLRGWREAYVRYIVPRL